MSSNIKVHSVVIGITRVIAVRNRTEAVIEPGRNLALVSDQIAGKIVDVDTIADNPVSVAVVDYVVGMGPGIADAGGKIISQSPLHGGRPDIRFRGFQQGINAPYGKTSAGNSTLRVKAALKRREGKSKRRLVAGSENKNGSVRGRGPAREKGR